MLCTLMPLYKIRLDLYIKETQNDNLTSDPLLYAYRNARNGGKCYASGTRSFWAVVYESVTILDNINTPLHLRYDRFSFSAPTLSACRSTSSQIRRTR